MTSQQLAKLKLPDAPGVYIFRDDKKRPLYIGRATSLRDRTRSYFSVDLIDTRGPRIVDMVTKAHTVTYEGTDSVLEAVLLESELIKRYQPFYNVDERDDKSSQYVVITEEEWPRVFLARGRDFDQGRKDESLEFEVKRAFGPFPESGLIKEALRILRRLFPFKDKKSIDPRHDAFYRALGRSPDSSSSEAHERYMQTIDWLILFFEGKKRQLKRELEAQMNACAEEMRFEDAGQFKRLLYALDHINDISLIKREKTSADGSKRTFRMEAYDVAHISGTNVVGAMVASENGEFANSEYRKFKISRHSSGDIAGLREILERRLNHPEWPYPDLILVDGNEAQMKAAEEVLQARRIAIPVIAVTKDERHKAAGLLGDPRFTKKYKNEIVALNAECHRFAVAFHRLRRGKFI